GWGWLTGTLKTDAITITFTLVAFAAATFFILRGHFREAYVFNKKSDTYTFTRQSILNRDVLEGSASQFRAVQIERRTDYDDDKEVLAVALLMQVMLLAQSARQILRKKPPLLNSLATEKRIAAAIAKFLNIPREGVIDVL